MLKVNGFQLLLLALFLLLAKPCMAAASLPGADPARVFKNARVGGVVLYGYNFRDIEQTVKLTRSLQKNAGSIPMFIAADQEGGRVTRLPMGTVMPGSMALGAAGSPEYAYGAGRVAGRELHALGINVNLGPVLDICQDDKSVIGIRSFGADPRAVAELGAAYIRGLRDAGVIATAKHFPGHGDTPQDSHITSPVVPHNLERLMNVEMLPFRRAFDSGAEMLMTAHAAYPAVDGASYYNKAQNRNFYLPATLSYKILTELARDRVGFEGVILTDAMHMKAVKNITGKQEDAAVMAVKAGADMIMVHSGLQSACSRLLDAVKRGEVSSRRIDQSVKRILQVKLNHGLIKIFGGTIMPGNQYGLPLDEEIAGAKAVVNCWEHRALEQRVAERAVTLLKNDGLLPFTPGSGSRIVIFAPSEDILSGLDSAVDAALKARGTGNIQKQGYSFKNLGTLTGEHKGALAGADYVILATCSYSDAERNPARHRGAAFGRDLAGYALSANKPLAVMAVGDPYDIMYMPEVKAYLAVYGGAAGPNTGAGIKTVFGLNNPGGKLPVPIPGQDGREILYPLGFGLSY